MGKLSTPGITADSRRDGLGAAEFAYIIKSPSIHNDVPTAGAPQRGRAMAGSASAQMKLRLSPMKDKNP
jgi:hypothetical protein